MSVHIHSFEKRFLRFLTTAARVECGQSILLAVSGGVDSMVMAHLFVQVRDPLELDLSIAHVNHGLRGQESVDDEAFVRKTAEAFGLPCFATTIPTRSYARERRISTQEAARELRYCALEDFRLQAGADLVATAHHANDNAETLLLNAMRGAGVRGLSGIPIRREPGHVVRPLLFATRQEIETYARERSIPFRRDSSNESLKYRRNYVRKIVLPLVESDLGPDAVLLLTRLASAAGRLQNRLDEEVRMRWRTVVGHDSEGRFYLNIPAFRSLPRGLQEQLAVALLRTLGVDLQMEKVSMLLDLCSLPTGRSFDFSKSVAALRDRDRIVFGSGAETTEFLRPVSIGSRCKLPTFEFALTRAAAAPARLGMRRNTEFVDADALQEPLVLRTWREGDWFVPIGMTERKKLSDFFTDEKISSFEKRRIPILESAGRIVWVCGRRLDDRFKVTEKTRSLVKLEYHPTATAS